jgi:hypothetical protein
MITMFIDKKKCFLLFWYRSIIGTVTACGAASDDAENKKRYEKLQFDIQNIAEAFTTYYQIPYSKWTIKKIGNRESGKRFMVHTYVMSL